MRASLNPKPVPSEPHTRFVTVVDGDEFVMVHWHYKRGPNQPTHMYRCSECGHADRGNECEHVFAAALLLADKLLGLTAAGSQRGQ